jgi:N-acetyl-gamma-glutamyl-phosphate reductase
MPEMKTVCGLEKAPLFIPVVDDYPRGMLVMVPVASGQLTRPLSLQEMQDHFRQWYQGTAVAVQEGQPGLYAGDKAGTDDLELFVTGAESGSGFVIAARFDNLGKGACGAAIRNMELMLGLDTGQ